MEKYIKTIVYQAQSKKINYTENDIKSIFERIPQDFFENQIKKYIYIGRYDDEFKVNLPSKDDIEKIYKILDTNKEILLKDKKILKNIVSQIIKIFINANKDIKEIDIVEYILGVFVRHCLLVSDLNCNDIKDILEESNVEIIEETSEESIEETIYKKMVEHSRYKCLEHKSDNRGRILVEHISIELCVRTSIRSVINLVYKYFYNTKNIWNRICDSIFKDLENNERPIVMGINRKLLVGNVYYSELLNEYAKNEEDFRNAGEQELKNYATSLGVTEESDSDIDLTDWINTNWDMLGIKEVDLDKYIK